MTDDVLAYGDEKPPHRWPRSLTVFAVVGALVAGGVAVAATRGSRPRHRPGSTGYTSPTPDPVLDQVPVDDRFADAISVRRPADGSVIPLLMPGDVPGFLASRPPNWYALVAAGGPAFAPVLVGWCAPQRTFQDRSASYVYSADGAPFSPGPTLARATVRAHPGDGHLLDIAADAERGLAPRAMARPTVRCPVALTYPPLPPRTTNVHATLNAHRLVRGRYVVTTENRAFCAAVRPSGCADQGWEEYGPGGEQMLPPGELAGSYTWEGDFLVRADSRSGALAVIRMPTARLVRREQVGVAVRVGIARGTYVEDGVVHLRFNPMRHVSGTPGDDSPPGPPEQGVDRPDLMADIRGGVIDYVVRADADIVLGEGVTGLGQPRATPDTLRRFIVAHPNGEPPLWLILDPRGRVLRVVAEAAVRVLHSEPPA